MKRAPSPDIHHVLKQHGPQAAWRRGHAACQWWWENGFASEEDRAGRLLARPPIRAAAELLLADRSLGLLPVAQRRPLAECVAQAQLPDGTWADVGGAACPGTTLLATWALRGAPEVEVRVDPSRTRRRLLEFGGAQRLGFTERLWLSLSGSIPWSWMPTIMSEMWLLPEHSRWSPRALPPWTREVSSAFHVLSRVRARLHLPPVDDLLARDHRGEVIPPRLTRDGALGDLLVSLEGGLRGLRRLHPRRARALGMRRALGWIASEQQSHGGWFSTRSTVLCMLAMRAAGAQSDDPAIERARRRLAGLRGRLPSARSPDGEPHTLHQAEFGITAQARARIARAVGGRVPVALLEDELDVVGSWSRDADTPAGGWPFEREGRGHLDVDATCSTLAALDEVSRDGTADSWAARRRARQVLLAMQLPDGSFARFERGERGHLLERLPWRDSVTLRRANRRDASALETTLRTVRRLHQLGVAPGDDRIDRAMRWVLRTTTHPEDQSTSNLALMHATLHRHLPTSHALREGVEHELRTRQTENGTFGDLIETARVVRALCATGGPCVQATRAVEHLTRQVMSHDDAALRCIGDARPTGPGDIATHAAPVEEGICETTLALRAYLDVSCETTTSRAPT